jgi:hypothetical protein
MKGYRTILFNVAAGVPLVAAAAMPVISDAAPTIIQTLIAPELKAMVPSGWEKWYTLAVLVGNIYLRSITTGPVGRQ